MRLQNTVKLMHLTYELILFALDFRCILSVFPKCFLYLLRQVGKSQTELRDGAMINGVHEWERSETDSMRWPSNWYNWKLKLLNYWLTPKQFIASEVCRCGQGTNNMRLSSIHCEHWTNVLTPVNLLDELKLNQRSEYRKIFSQ